MLTGYIGSASFLNDIVTVVERVKAANPNMRYVCDPVMGDNGAFYVPPELAPLFREKVCPLAYMITPNQFEAEQLTETTIEDE